LPVPTVTLAANVERISGIDVSRAVPKIILCLNLPDPPKPESTRPLNGEFNLLPKIAPFWINGVKLFSLL
jgi:hypothetical protein